MPYNTKQATYEAAVAKAHRAVHQAHLAAIDAGQLGAGDDLWQILSHLSTIGMDALNRKPRGPRIVGGTQLELPHV